MNKDLELALKIKATHDGLGDIKATIAEIRRAGVATDEWEAKADELGDALNEASKAQSMIDNFVRLKKETLESGKALEQAQQQTQALAREYGQLEKPTKKQANDFKRAREEVGRIKTAYENNRLAVQKMRGELTQAGISTRNMAQHQVTARKATEAAKNRLRALNEELQRHVKHTRASTTANTANASSHRKISAGVESISTQLATLQTRAVGLFGLTQGTQLIADLSRMTDTYTNLTSRMKLAVGEGQAFETGMEDIQRTANDTGTALESVGELYITLNRATKELNLSQKEVADLTDTISKSFLVSGASSQAADAAITQLAQGLQSGVLRGDEFNSVMEQSPRLAQAMTDALGVTRGELRAMAEDGKLSTETIVNALQSQAQAIADEAERMPDTIGRSAQRVKNEFLLAIGEMDEGFGVSEKMAASLNHIAENMDAVINTLELAGEVATAALIRRFVPAVVTSGSAMLAAARNGTLFSASLTGVAGSATIASRALGLLKGSIPLIAFTFAIDQIGKLISKINEISDASEALQESENALTEMNQKLAEEYKNLSEQTGVVITNMDELDAALRAGTITIDEQTGAYVSAAQAAELKARRDLEASEAAVKMSYTQAELSARMAETNKQLQQAVEDNSKLSSVMSGALLDAMNNGETGVAAFAIALRGAEQQGKLTTEQIETGLSAALAGLSDEERTRFGEMLKVALSKVASGADDASVSVDQLSRLLGVISDTEIDSALSRLGLAMTDLTGGISQGTAQALEDLQILSHQLVSLGMSAEEASGVIQTAISSAFRNARTEADRTALTAWLNHWREGGLLTAESFDEITQSISRVNAAAQSLDGRMRDAGIRSQASLNSVSESARQLYDDLVENKAPLNDQREAFLRYAESAVAANQYVSNAQKESVVQQLRVLAAMNGLSEVLEQLLQQYGLQGDEGEESGERVADGADKATEANKRLSTSVANSTRDVQKVAASLADWFGAVRNEMSGLSEQARVLFDDKLGLQSSGTVTEVDALKASLAAAREELGKIAIDNLQTFDATGINKWKNSVLKAKDETIIAYQEQKLKFLEYTNAIESGSRLNEGFINQAQNALQTMDLLGNEDLSQLQSAIDSATRKLESMTDAAKSALTGLQDELDRLQGNQDAIDQREYEEKRMELAQALDEARKWGNDQAIKYYSDALKTLEDVRRERQQQARESSSSSNSTSSSGAQPAQSSGSTYNVNITLGNKQTTASFDSASDKATFMEMLEEFKNRSGG